MDKNEEIRQAFWEADDQVINLEWETDIAPLVAKGAKFMSLTGSAMHKIVDQLPKLENVREVVFQIVSGRDYKVTVGEIDQVKERMATLPSDCSICWGFAVNPNQTENIRFSLLYL